MTNRHTACFIGHRTIDETKELKRRLRELIEKLITDEHIDTFLFGSKSRFNDLCYELVTEIKQQHPHIKRVYVRVEFPFINDIYKNYLLESFEDTCFIGLGKAAYIERNRYMIDNSRLCVIYYNEQNVPVSRKSGTKIALEYATKNGKEILLLP